MIKTIFGILIAIILLGSQQSMVGQCIADTNNIYTFVYAGNHYEIVKEKQTWVNAAACAAERGGFLAEIYSKEEQDSIYYHLRNAGITVSNTVAPDGGNASYVWIGGNDIGTEGKWVWDGNNDGTFEQFWQGIFNGSPVRVSRPVE